VPEFKGLLFDVKNPKLVWQQNKKYLPMITTEVLHINGLKIRPRRANTLSENLVKKHFNITFDGCGI